jgi:photosystem II stability/assembly factor-like uncharacterized protein
MINKIISTAIIALFINNSNVNAQSWAVQGANISSGSIFIGDICAVNDNVVWALAESTNGGTCGSPCRIFTKTTNGGAKWKSGNIIAPFDYTTWNISAIDSNIAWVATFNLATQSNGRIYKTSNGGVTWQHQTTANFTSSAKFVHFYNANEGVCVGENEVFTTTNGGTNWTAQSALPVPFSANTFFAINSYETLGDNIWLGDYAGIMYHSADKGLTWTVKSNQNTVGNEMAYTEIKGITFKDNLNGMAVSAKFQSGGNGGGGMIDNGYLFKTNDGGSTWTKFYYSIPFSYLQNSIGKYDIIYVPNTTNTWIVSSIGIGVSFSSITTDGGATWSWIDSTTGHSAMAFTPNGFGWSGGDITSITDGIFKFKSGAIPSAIENFQKKLNENITIQYEDDKIYLNNEMTSFKISNIQISSFEGKHIATIIPTQQSKQTINTSLLTAGIYIMTISDGKNVINKKFQIK